MPVYQDVAPPVPKTFTAESAIVANRFVKLGAAANGAAPIAAGTDRPMGVAVESADPAQGNSAVSVYLLNEGGIVPIEASAAIALGAAIAPAADGRGVTSGAGSWKAGRALVAAGGAGEIIPMLVEPSDQVT